MKIHFKNSINSVIPQITNVIVSAKNIRHRVKRRRLKIWIALNLSQRSYWTTKDIDEDEIL